MRSHNPRGIDFLTTAVTSWLLNRKGTATAISVMRLQWAMLWLLAFLLRLRITSNQAKPVVTGDQVFYGLTG